MFQETSVSAAKFLRNAGNPLFSYGKPTFPGSFSDDVPLSSKSFSQNFDPGWKFLICVYMLVVLPADPTENW